MDSYHSLNVFGCLTHAIPFIAVFGVKVLLCDWIAEMLHDHARNLRQLQQVLAGSLSHVQER
jgi:hypothetical protein